VNKRPVPKARRSFVAGDFGISCRHRRVTDPIFDAFRRILCQFNDAGISTKSRGDLLYVPAERSGPNFAVKTRFCPTKLYVAAEGRCVIMRSNDGMDYSCRHVQAQTVYRSMVRTAGA
jgi:hypothetical protein